MSAAIRRVWGIGTARTMRAHWALAELGLDYETRPIMPRHPTMDDAEFLARSERGKVPIYEEGEVVMGESAAIVMWLADRYREPVCLAPAPADPDRAAYLDLCQYAMTELDSPLYTIRMHGGLPEEYGEAPNAVAAARAYFARMAGEIDRRLADDRPYLLGAQFTAADLLVVSCLTWAQVLQIQVSELLCTYRDRVIARPACKAALAKNFPPEAMAHLAGKIGAPD